MNYSLLANDLPPLIIKKSEKNKYMQILGEAQAKVFPSNEDIENFIAFAKPIMKEEERRMNSFSNKASKQIENIVESSVEKNKRLEKIEKRYGSLKKAIIKKNLQVFMIAFFCILIYWAVIDM